MVVFRMVFLFLCCFSYSHAKAQVLTSNNIQATILSGTQVSVKGDILITNGATIDNTGIIDLSGTGLTITAHQFLEFRKAQLF
ncbi:MAG: hypothetical protein IPP34_08115 [Bacteroidetes bacterium]|nr:hypothetical protein [Bacteroidota bacterium]